MSSLRLIPLAGGKPHEIDRDEVLIGRDPGCDIIITDGSVSRKHARIVRRAGGWAVVDQASANGTYVDSQRVADVGLRNGHEVRFGAVSFRVELAEPEMDLAATVSPDQQQGATVIQQPGMINVHTAPTSETPRPSLGSGPRPPAPPRPPSPPPPPPPPLPRGGSLPPPAPMPGPAPGGAPPRQGRSPVFWIVGGCCGCLLLAVLAVLAIVGSVYVTTQAPVEAIRAQLGELREGNAAAAYARLSQSYQSQMSEEQFELFVAQHPAIRKNADSSFWHRSVKNDEAEISGVLTAQSGETESVRYHLVKEGGEWKISSIEVPASSSWLLPAPGGIAEAPATT